jgi:hypothetical protein
VFKNWREETAFICDRCLVCEKFMENKIRLQERVGHPKLANPLFDRGVVTKESNGRRFPCAELRQFDEMLCGVPAEHNENNL